jgi:hypothetical protein
MLSLRKRQRERTANVPGQSKTYQIKAQGQLDESWSEWFDQMTVTVECGTDGLPVTILTGHLVDQAALHGILRRINDLNLPLLSVTQIDVDEKDSDTPPQR